MKIKFISCWPKFGDFEMNIFKYRRFWLDFKWCVFAKQKYQIDLTILGIWICFYR